MTTNKSIYPASESVTLQALGGAGTVTGSKHLLGTPSFNLLIDCGLFQGIKSLREKNWLPFPVNPAGINAVILTHAHLDHCGYLPLLFKQGFKGKVFMSDATCELAELILRDSAKLQEEDAEKANRHRYSKHQPAKPLYNTRDVEACLPNFVRCNVDTDIKINEDIRFRFLGAGHISGACSVLVEAHGKKILFSGDIGRYTEAFMKSPENDVAVDVVVMESTYGDRLHEDYNVDERLAFEINRALERNGNILIPCFAVGRAQELIYRLHQLKLKKEIPEELPVYLDSPMAESAGRITMRYPGWLAMDPMDVRELNKGVIINEDYTGTDKIIRRPGSKIVLAASGMLTGGRVLEYLKHYLPDHHNTILLVGFQAAGTRGRALINHANEIKIHGHYYPVEAHIEQINALSAHADQAELLRWLKNFKTRPKKIFLVHGEPSAMEALRIKVKDTLGIEPVIPQPEENILLYTTARRHVPIL